MKTATALRHITVLLADDHTVVREGLRAMLEAEGDIEIIGEAETGRQAVDLTRKLRPDVVVMDIAMPILNGLEATRQIRKAVPEAKVLILSAHSDDAYIEQVTSLGGRGYLLKQTSARFLAEAIREVHKGNTYFSPSIARHLKNQYEKTSQPGELHKREAANLTSREMEVLQLISEGQANKQVASELGISVKTVEKHRQRVMEKLNIHDTASLTRYAISAGIIENSVQVTIL
jgi:DNA-binding NarL/FixJ family response regulator